jgi:hypothetical protein
VLALPARQPDGHRRLPQNAELQSRERSTSQRANRMRLHDKVVSECCFLEDGTREAAEVLGQYMMRIKTWLNTAHQGSHDLWPNHPDQLPLT